MQMSAQNPETLSELITIKLSPSERRFLERQAQAELRSISNLIRSYIIERMQHVAP
jgi:hypothetical protein